MNSISRTPSSKSLPPPARSAIESKASHPSENTPESKKLIRAKAVFAEPSSFTPEYQLFLRQLRQARKDSGLTQVQLGEKLGQPQAIISKCERGERRLDVIELRAYCLALGISYLDFLQQLEGMVSAEIGA